jgi:ABC-2 type transport system permease protein
MLNLYRLKELTQFDFCYSLANLKSLAFIIPYFFFWFVFFEKISDVAVEKIQSAQGLFVASWALDNQNLATQLFVDNPASLSIYLLVSISITPLFILLAANNQFSSDASRGAFRFILTRATRTEIYLSRFIAVTLLVLSCYLITSLWASIQSYLNREDELLVIINYGFQTYTLLSFYSLPFIAFMSTISVLTRSAFGCLFFGIMMYVLFLTISIMLKDDISYSIYLIPSGIKSTLIDINLKNVLTSIAALSCYTLVYFTCGWFVFKRKDM